MTTPFHVRIAKLHEAAAVIDLYRGYDRPPERELTASEIERIFIEINEKGYIAVALADDLVVGTYSIYFCSNLAHAGRSFAVIENVIVAAHMQRLGIGTALMSHA